MERTREMGIPHRGFRDLSCLAADKRVESVSKNQGVSFSFESSSLKLETQEWNLRCDRSDRAQKLFPITELRDHHRWAVLASRSLATHRLIMFRGRRKICDYTPLWSTGGDHLFPGSI
ncbi:hypothetical protein PGT21_015700 [Puccinia graminis f. sp. tritici]|uniref:Uncharacterized protein n=1 Tax=Puccinia graminis f. sp. tritici TaxID=56615 RepID=A0A5B0R0Q2_PUCGR|nr:hypothetical protein PGT21_015700 [Puccinia graminis f. sp. tritici]